MEEIFDKTIILIQELTNSTLERLEQLSTGYLVPELLI